jgi:hypothetical protein
MQERQKYLGVWMDHSEALLINFKDDVFQISRSAGKRK